MRITGRVQRAAAAAVIALIAISTAAHGADYPKPKEGDWIACDFKFYTGEVMSELRLHYTTVGEPSGEPVLVLHGTTDGACLEWFLPCGDLARMDTELIGQLLNGPIAFDSG